MRLLIVEFKNCMKRTEFLIALLIMFLSIFVDFILLCKNYYGLGLSDIISAKNAMIITNNLKSPLCYVYSILLPIITSLIYSDSYIMEKNYGISNMIYTRVNKAKSIWIKGIAVFLVSFFVVLIPLIVEFVFVIIVLPLQGHYNLGLASYKELIYFDPNKVLIRLATYRPYTNLIVFIFIRAAFGAVFSLFSYSISFFKKVNRYIVIISSFFTYFIISILCDTLSKLIPEKKYSLFLGTNILGVNGYGSIYMIMLVFILFLGSSIIFIQRGIHKEL